MCIGRPNGKRTRTLNADGEVGAGRRRMWQSMRILRVFTTGDIAATAEVPIKAAQGYCRELAKGGYLRKEKRTQPGLSGYFLLYRLVRNSGPHAPRVQGSRGLPPDAVWDPNEHRVYPFEDITQ